MRVATALKEGRTFVAWALRTQNLDAVRAKLEDAGVDVPPVVEGTRRRPDGQVLAWRTQDIVLGAEPTAIPFVIEWQIPDGLHPGEGAAAHRGGATALRRVIVGAREPDHVRERLELLLGESDMYEVRASDADGVEEIVVEDGSGKLVVS